MTCIDVTYILKRMLRMLWLAVIVGVLLAGAYFAKNMISSKAVTQEAGSMKAEDKDERYTFEAYQGDYLSYPETDRYLLIPYRFTNDIVSQITDSTIHLNDYSGDIGVLMVERLQTGSFSQGAYRRLLDQFPELKQDQKVFNIFVLENEMLEPHVDKQAALWIAIKAPLSLRELSSYEYTDEQLCAYRDALYGYVGETLENSEIFSDLSVTLHRAESIVEDSASEQFLIVNKLKDATEDEENNENNENNENGDVEVSDSKNSIKNLLLYFILGAVAVEGVVFLLAVMNDTVKGKKDFERNTDVEVLDEIETGTDKPDFSKIAVKVGAALQDGETLILLSETPCEDWCSGLQSALETLGRDVKVIALSTNSLSWDELLQLTNAKALIAVQTNKTNYKMLRNLSAELRQVHTDVIGAVLF